MSLFEVYDQNGNNLFNFGSDRICRYLGNFTATRIEAVFTLSGKARTCELRFYYPVYLNRDSNFVGSLYGTTVYINDFGGISGISTVVGGSEETTERYAREEYLSNSNIEVYTY